MHLAKRKGKDGEYYYSIKHGFRNKEGKSTSKTILTIGYLNDIEEVKKKFPEVVGDPVAYFTNLATKMSAENKVQRKTNLSIDLDEFIPLDSSRKGLENESNHSNECKGKTDNSFNYGSIVLSSIYHELELHEFFTNRAKYRKFKFLPNKVMQLLIFSRILEPQSKLATQANAHKYFDIEHDEQHKISLDDVYYTLDFIEPLKKDIIKWLNTRIESNYTRDTSVIFYDVTNYRCASNKTSDLRQLGYSKENSKRPIISMGLAVDSDGIPITYELFSGNTHDSKTYDDMLINLRDNYKTKKIVIVADRGLNSGDNIAHTYLEGNGYIFGQSIGNLSKEEKEYVFNNDNFEVYKSSIDGEFKYKARIAVKKLRVSSIKTKTKRTVELDQKQLVIYSSKYASRAKKKRDKAIEKAKKIMKNPSMYDKHNDKGAFAYIQNIKIDDKTGEVTKVDNRDFRLDHDKIDEEAKYDGYYMIVTSELDMDNKKILESYHELWRIEETFKITKSDLQTRPIYHNKDSRIKAHFLMCYISIVIIRLLQYKMKKQYSCPRLIKELNKINCTYADQGLYLFGYRSVITEKFNEIFNLEIGKKWMSKKEINQTFSNLRK